MARPNPFDIQSYNLGDSKLGIDRLGVDQSFHTAPLHSAPKCLICSNDAHYKLIPKFSHLATAEIEDRGFTCQHCITIGHISPNQYGLREL